MSFLGSIDTNSLVPMLEEPYIKITVWTDITNTSNQGSELFKASFDGTGRAMISDTTEFEPRKGNSSDLDGDGVLNVDDMCKDTDIEATPEIDKYGCSQDQYCRLVGEFGQNKRSCDRADFMSDERLHRTTNDCRWRRLRVANPCGAANESEPEP